MNKTLFFLFGHAYAAEYVRKVRKDNPIGSVWSVSSDRSVPTRRDVPKGDARKWTADVSRTDWLGRRKVSWSPTVRRPKMEGAFEISL